jgi:hypothetical protein
MAPSLAAREWDTQDFLSLGSLRDEAERFSVRRLPHIPGGVAHVERIRRNTQLATKMPASELPYPQANVGNTSASLHGYNYNLCLCYPSRMADFHRNGMLFSSGDSPNSFRDPFGGWAR